MLFNQTVPWRPTPFAPVIRPRVMAQAVPASSAAASASPAIPMGVKAFALTFAIAMAGATAWVGIDTGMRRKGFLSILGYVIGAGGALSGVIDIAALGFLTYQAISGSAPTAPDMKTTPPLM